MCAERSDLGGLALAFELSNLDTHTHVRYAMTQVHSRGLREDGKGEEQHAIMGRETEKVNR